MRFIQVTGWTLRQRPDISTLLEQDPREPGAPLLFGQSKKLALPSLHLLIQPGLSVRRILPAREKDAEFIFVYPTAHPTAQAYLFTLTHRDLKKLRDNRLPPASDLWNVFDQPWLDASTSDYAFHLACRGGLYFTHLERFFYSPNQPSPLSSFK